MDKKTKSHRCQICGRDFLLKTSLKMHALSHNVSGIDQVRIVKVISELNNGNQLMGNSESVDSNKSKSKTYECNICGMYFALKLCFKAHLVKCQTQDSSLNSQQTSIQELFHSKSVFKAKTSKDEELRKFRDIETAKSERSLTKSKGMVTKDIVKPNVSSDDTFLLQLSGDETPMNQTPALERHSKANDHIQSVVNSNSRIGQYDCSICKDSFESSSAYKEHLRLQTYPCSDCEESFPECVLLKNHKRIHFMHQYSTYEESKSQNHNGLPSAKVVLQKKSQKCSCCSQSFPSQNDLRVHQDSNSEFHCMKCKKKICSAELLKKHNEQRSFDCFLCIESFMSCEELVGHKKSHKNRVCWKCRKVFPTEEALNIHVTQDNYHCEVCDQIFTKCESLKCHMKSHPLKCKICHKSLLYLSSLQKHEAMHSKEELMCEHCGREFLSLVALKKHIRKVHVSKCKVLCDICGKTVSKRAYKTHKCLESHPDNTITVYQCSVCDKVYRRRSYLTMHMRIHASENPYTCDKCNKTFTCEGAFNGHMRMHAGGNRCSECDKVFSTKGYLKEHMRIHTGVKSFECGICSKAFYWMSGLHRHMRIHSGERPYKCGICEKTFLQLDHAKSHVVLHTGERPYQCDQCGAAFAHKCNMTTHRKIHLKNKGT